MREDWEIEKLQNICYQIADIDHKMPKAKEVGVAFISAKDLDNHGNIHFENCKKISEDDYKRLSRKILPKAGDIIYSRIGTIGRAAIVKVGFPFLASYSCCTIKPNTTVIENQFLRDYLASYSCLSQALSGVVGIGVPDLGMRQIREFSIPIPSLPEQRAIVAKIEELFSELDKGEEDLKKAQEQLKIYRQAVLKKAFEGEWKKLSLGELGTWGSGGTPSRANPEYFKGSIPWVKTGELGSKYITTAEEKITEQAIKNSSAKLFPSNSVAIAMYGATIGKTSIFKAPLSTNQACAVVQPKDSVNVEFLYYLLTSMKRNFISLGKGGAQPNISQTLIKQQVVPLPDLESQKVIVQEIESRLSVCDSIEESIHESLDKSKALRQSILKKAFEGTLLSEEEIAACKEAPDYEPASVLLERIKAEKKKN